MEPERVFLHYPGQDNHKPQDVDDEFSWHMINSQTVFCKHVYHLCNHEVQGVQGDVYRRIRGGVNAGKQS